MQFIKEFKTVITIDRFVVERTKYKRDRERQQARKSKERVFIIKEIAEI